MSDIKNTIEQALLKKLWSEISNVERVIVTIPASYNPNDRTMRIPNLDTRGRGYTVIATPFDHIEEIFRKYFIPAAPTIKQ